MKLKKLIIPAAMCMILAGGVIPSFANNYGDTTFKYSFGNFMGARYTEGRRKMDASSSYMDCYSTGNTYVAEVVANLGDGEYANCKSPHYVFYSGSVKKMANYVHEKGYRNAAIKAWPSLHIGSKFSANGVWSPDSI